jgi:hypothetical protein
MALYACCLLIFDELSITRCFVYLFPSTQTWFLFLVMITLT